MNIPGMQGLTVSDNAPIWDVVQGSCNADEIQELIKADGSIVTLKQDGWSPLHYACENRSVGSEALQWILSSKPEINQVDENGWSALHLLCKNSNIIHEKDLLIQMMLKAGAAADLKTTDNGKLALHLLCENENGEEKSIQSLLKHCSNINAEDKDGNTALHYICNNEHALTSGSVAALLKQKANPNTKNLFDTTPLHQLCQNSKISLMILRNMLSSGADPNRMDNIRSTPLHYLCSNEAFTIDLLREMISNGKADLLARNSLGKMPVDMIQDTGDAECIAFVQKYTPHRKVGKTAAAVSDGTAGGEDVSAVEGVLKDELTKWNATLPPFDVAFYMTVCCDPAFEQEYNQVQEISMKLHAAPSDAATLKLWKEKLTSWRKRVLVVFLSLMDPSLWVAQEKAYNRPIPSDVNQVKDKIVTVWKSYPEHSQRRDRLQRINDIINV